MNENERFSLRIANCEDALPLRASGPFVQRGPLMYDGFIARLSARPK